MKNHHVIIILEMMEDADKGKFDLIITHEVSGFARNTVDTLQETRKLKAKNIEVWFTEDNIWTLNDDDGELRLLRQWVIQSGIHRQ